MSIEDRIDIDIFKAVTRAIAASDNLIIMANHLSQLLVGTLGVKGCSLFALDPGTRELEILGSFGLSMAYVSKGPVFAGQSVSSAEKGEAVVIRDVNDTDLLQYPDEARSEGIGAIVGIPVMLYGEPIGALRLYHHETWDISERDLDSLMLLGETIGLAMTYTRILNAFQSLKAVLDGVHPIWLKPGRE